MYIYYTYTYAYYIYIILYVLYIYIYIYIYIYKPSSAGGESHKSGTLLIGKVGSHYVILLYYETLLQVLLGVY